MSNPQDRELTYSLTYRDVIEVLRLVKDNAHCESLEVQLGDLKLSATRKSSAAAAPPRRHQPAASAPPQGAPLQHAEQGLGEGPTADISAAANAVTVRAPMLGTFYRAPTPGAPPYVQVGDVVGQSDTVGLIDVMKLFTPITAGVAGRVVEIFAENATIVEYGQALLLIEPLQPEPHA